MAARWRHTPQGYTLDTAELSAELVVAVRTPGLRNLSTVAGPRWPGPLLAVQSVQVAGRRPFAVGGRARRIERRLRTGVVDLQVESSRACPVRLQLYWRASGTSQIDLEVLVGALTPSERLEVVTLSRVGAAEALVPFGDSRSKWLDVREANRAGAKQLVVPRDEAAARFSLDGRTPQFGDFTLAAPFAHPIVLHRPHAQDWSYVEMSHPEDCARVIVTSFRQTTQHSFGLFGFDLEKGVIPRGRVRGVFVPRQGDTIRASRLFSAFAAEPPHLSV